MDSASKTSRGHECQYPRCGHRTEHKRCKIHVYRRQNPPKEETPEWYYFQKFPTAKLTNKTQFFICDCHGDLGLEKPDDEISKLKNEIRELKKEVERYKKILSRFTPSQIKKMAGECVAEWEQKAIIQSINIRAGIGRANYDHIASIFPLPSSRTVEEKIRGICWTDGIIGSVEKSIRMAIKDEKMNELDRHGFLAFDETAIKSGFYFDQSSNFVEGAVSFEFEDTSNGLPATKALLYIFIAQYTGKMIPVAFYYTPNKTNGLQLKRCTEDVIEKLESAALEIK